MEMSQQTNLETLIREIVEKVTKIKMGQVGSEEDLVEKYGMDSMQRIEIVIAIEKHFNVSIPDAEAGEVRTLRTFVQVVLRYLSEK